MPQHPFEVEPTSEVLPDVAEITPKKRGRKPAAVAQAGTTEVPTEFLTGLLAMFAEKMNEVIKAAKEPPFDPIKQKQHERAQEAKKRAEESYWKGLQNKAINCNHTREDLTSAIAWATQSDGLVRGSCQHCQTLFSPNRNECVSEEVWKQYKERLRVPTQRGNSVVYV